MNNMAGLLKLETVTSRSSAASSSGAVTSDLTAFLVPAVPSVPADSSIPAYSWLQGAIFQQLLHSQKLQFQSLLAVSSSEHFSPWLFQSYAGKRESNIHTNLKWNFEHVIDLIVYSVWTNLICILKILNLYQCVFFIFVNFRKINTI